MIKWYGPERMGELKKDGERRMMKAVLVLERDVKMNFTRTPRLMGKKGKRRRAGPGQQLYVPSRPGEPPAVQTGRLRRSITNELSKDREGAIGRVGPAAEAPYGKFLEFGTRKMAARPFMRPSLERMKRQLWEILST